MNETESSLQLNVIAESRHPEDQKAYDPEQHVYQAAYVQPSGWRLSVTATLPPAVDGWQWEVVETEGQFRESGPFPDEGELTFQVPHPGQYELTVKAQAADGRVYTAGHRFHLRDYLIAAVGDSYFCGEGTPDMPGKPHPVADVLACNLATFTKFLIEKADLQIPMAQEPVWQEKKAHRSYKSAPSQVARVLQDEAAAQVITLLNFARSGSSIQEGLLDPMPRDDWTTLGQIEELKRTAGERPIDALLISTGGNDIHFPDRLMDLIRGDFLLMEGGGSWWGNDALNRREEWEEAQKALALLPQRFEQLAEAVAALHARHVFLTQYPTAHFDAVNEAGEVVTWSGCGIFDGPDMDIDEKDAALIKESGQTLNEALRRAAEKYGWIYVDGIADGFAGHGRCAEEKFFYSAEESCHRQGDFRGTMHPNEKGIQVYVRCLEEALRKHLFSS